MRLSCRKALLVFAVSTLGCSETPSGPATFDGIYFLGSVNGQPLPFTILSPIPEETVTVLSAMLQFQLNSEVIWTERRRDHMTNAETTYTNTFTYRREGNRIEIGIYDSCPINDLCSIFEGIVNGSALHVKVGQLTPTTPIVYEFAEGVIN